VSAKRIRLVIADDQTLITQSFKILLETKAEDIDVVGLAQNGREAVALVRELKPDVVLLDVRMPVLDGVEAAREIGRMGADAKVIMLTTFDDDAYLNDAIGAGAVGYLLKDISTDELISSIRAASCGVVLVSPTVARRHFRAASFAAEQKESSPDEGSLAVLASLSSREIETFRLLVLGLENKQIAERLHVAEQTVKNNVSVIYTKLGVGNRRDARTLALKSRLIRPDTLLKDV
jgi:DNA-binding NarL/FixJ family response regulator